MTRIGYSFEEAFKDSFYNEPFLNQEQKNNFQSLLNLPQEESKTELSVEEEELERIKQILHGKYQEEISQ